MADRFTMPIESAFDDDGSSLPGAKLNFFITSTTTRKDTFSDDALTTPNANPVVADGAGRFGDIFMNDDVGYKVTLTDTDDVVIWTADPVTTPTSLAWTELTTSDILTSNLTGANQVRTTGFTTSGDEGGGMWLLTGNAGAAGTTDFPSGLLYDSAGNEFKIDAGGVVDPRQFGAVGDGVTAAQEVLINNAIDFLADETIAGGIVSLGPGDYLTDNALSPRAGIWIRGSGVGATKLTLSGTNDSVHAIDAGNTDNTNVQISDFEIDMALGTTAGHGIRFSDGANDSRIWNMYIHDTPGYGIGYQAATVGFVNVWIDSVYIKNAGQDGIDFKDPGEDNQGIEISRVIVDGVGQLTASQAGIDIRGIANLSDIQVINLNEASPAADTGIRFRSSSFFGTEGATGRKSTLTGFYVQGTGALSRGINISGRHSIASNGVTEMSGATSRGCIIDSPDGAVHTFDPGDVAGNVVTDVAHGWDDNHGPVMVEAGTSLDTGLTADTPYWIDVLTDDTYSFLVSSGGATVTLNSDGVGTTTVIEIANDISINNVKFIGGNTGIVMSSNVLRSSISSCEFLGCSKGIGDSGTDAVIDSCRFDQCTTGVTVEAVSVNCELSNNGFYDGAGVGISLTALSSGARLLWNKFRGNVSEITNTGDTNAVFQGNHGVSTPTLAPAATVVVPPNAGQVLISVSGTSIDIITATFDGDEISLIFVGVSTVADESTNSGNVQLAGGADFVGSANDTLRLRYESSTGFWYDFGQSVN